MISSFPQVVKSFLDWELLAFGLSLELWYCWYNGYSLMQGGFNLMMSTKNFFISKEIAPHLIFIHYSSMEEVIPDFQGTNQRDFMMQRNSIKFDGVFISWSSSINSCSSCIYFYVCLEVDALHFDIWDSEVNFGV